MRLPTAAYENEVHESIRRRVLDLRLNHLIENRLRNIGRLINLKVQLHVILPWIKQCRLDLTYDLSISSTGSG